MRSPEASPWRPSRSFRPARRREARRSRSTDADWTAGGGAAGDWPDRRHPPTHCSSLVNIALQLDTIFG